MTSNLPSAPTEAQMETTRFLMVAYGPLLNFTFAAGYVVLKGFELRGVIRPDGQHDLAHHIDAPPAGPPSCCGDYNCGGHDPCLYTRQG